MSLLTQGPLPVTAPLVLNPLMARMVEANLNVTEMCQMALDIRAVSSLPLILDGACGYGDPMHMHRTIGMTEAAGFAAIEIEDQLVPKRGSPRRDRAHDPDGADGGQGQGGGGGAARSKLTPLLAAYAAWKKTYEDFAKGFGAEGTQPEWGGLEKEMLATIDIEKLLAVERATVEK